VRLVYVSTAAPGLSGRDLEQIAAVGGKRNAAAGLTGLLLHSGACFYGILEGPSRRVFSRMEAIIADRRHSGVRVLREETIASRRFENWSFSSLPAIGRGPSETSEEFIWNLARRLR
jgi:hypothetical protein